MEEMHSAIAGVSDEYALADHARYLQVPADVWFEWTPEMRKGYVLGIQKLSINDVFKQKDEPWPSFESLSADETTEFRSLDTDIVEELVNSHGYSEENAKAWKKEVLYLLNHPTAIQRKASLQTGGAVQFEVASASSKNGTEQASVRSDHATCVCGRYKHDSICKHSLAVAALMSILCIHLNFIRKKSTKGHSKTAHAEYEVWKEIAGKKGGKNKHPYRPARGKETSPRGTITRTQEDQANTNPLYTEIYHNENTFNLMFLTDGAKRCKSCYSDFCHRKKVIPFDPIFSHKERWMFPVNGDWSNCRPSRQETVRYDVRFPFFSVDYVEIPNDVKDSLRDSHKKYLTSEFGLTFK